MISIGFVVGVVVTSVLVAAGAVAMALSPRFYREWRDNGSHDFDDSLLLARLLRWGGLTLAVVTALIAAWGFYPYDMQYHRYAHVQGTVASVQSRLLGDGKSTTQNYAVRLREDGQTYRCDDTRCSLLHEGDRISLWCIREWQYASTSGWGCNFDSTGREAR